MSKVFSAPPAADDLELARHGDGDAFARLVEPLRGELHAHCYRMLGSAHDADDALQEALVRAWRAIDRFEGRSSLRTWLYTVATHACLDAVKARGKRALPMDLGPSSDRAIFGDLPRAEVEWLSAYPSAGIDGALAAPGARYEQREAVELAFVAALQHLAGNQRAALLLVEVLGFTAAEVAVIMDTSVGSVHSALARARRIIAAKAPATSQQRTLRKIGDTRLREVVAEFSSALERGDADAFIALLTEDVTWSMPPLPGWYTGLEAVSDFARQLPLTRCGSWQHLPADANGQAAVASYLHNGQAYAAWSINVLTLRDGRIAEITSFLDPALFVLFGLPPSLP